MIDNMQNLVHIIIWARLGMAFEFVSSKYIFVDIAVQHLSITGLIDILYFLFFVHLEDSSEKQLECFYCAGANIDPDLLLAVFLPALLFESSFSMEVHQIKVPFLAHTFFICYSLTFYRVKGYIPPPSQHQPPFYHLGPSLLIYSDDLIKLVLSFLLNGDTRSKLILILYQRQMCGNLSSECIRRMIIAYLMSTKYCINLTYFRAKLITTKLLIFPNELHMVNLSVILQSSCCPYAQSLTVWNISIA